MINQFKSLLKQHLDHKVSVSELESGLRELLTKHPESNAELQSILLELASRKFIAKPVFDRLYGLCLQTQNANPQPADSPQEFDRRQVVSFQDSIKLFQENKCDYEFVEQCLLNDVRNDQDLLKKYEQAIQQLENRAILTPAISEKLRQVLSADKTLATSANKDPGESAELANKPAEPPAGAVINTTDNVSTLVNKLSGGEISVANVSDVLSNIIEGDFAASQAIFDDLLHEYQTDHLEAQLYLELLVDLEEKLALDLTGYKEQLQPNSQAASLQQDNHHSPPESIEEGEIGAETDSGVSEAKLTEEQRLESVAPASEEQDTEDKTVLRNSNSLQDSDSEDKTQFKKQQSVADDSDDRTQIRRDSDQTSQSSFTSQTSGTNTSSTWTRPLESSEEQEELQLGQVLKDRYKLIDFIGRGGMGDVFTAEDLLDEEIGGIKRLKAIKILNREFLEHEDSRKSLQREAQKTQELAHPHIVNVYNLERDKYHVFMTMELMTGEPLNSAIKKHKKGFGYVLAKKYITELCRALEHAHKKGVIHSDLKPGNIFISDGEIKVFDFGIARAMKLGTSHVNEENEEKEAVKSNQEFDVDEFFDEENQDDFDAGTLGALTPTYASPEMLDSELNEADPRDDIYALGCISYELLTGKHPFLDGKRKIPANEAQQLKKEPPKVPGLKPWQQEALSKTLAFKQEDRTASVSAFLNEFLQEKKALTAGQILERGTVAFSAVALSVWAYFYIDGREKRAFLKSINENRHQEVLKNSEDLIDKASDGAAIRQEKLEKRNKVFRDTEVSLVYETYIKKRVPELTAGNRFIEAIDLIQQANLLAPGGWLINLENATQNKYRNQIAQLVEELTAILNSDPEVLDYLAMEKIWNNLKQIAPENSALTSKRPAILLNSGITELIKNNRLTDARAMAQFALSFYAQDKIVFGEFVSVVSNQLDDIDKFTQEQNEEALVQQLSSQLESLQQATELSDYRQQLSALSQLAKLAPDSPLLREVTSNLEALLGGEIDNLIDDRLWENASQLIQEFEAALPGQFVTVAKEKIQSEQQRFARAVDEITRSVQLAVQSSQFDLAVQRIEELKTLTTSATDLDKVSGIVAQGWLVEARNRKNQQDWEAAYAAISNGLEFTSSASLKREFEKESLAIDQIKQELESKATEERLAAEQQQKEANISRLVGLINGTLEEAPASVGKIRQLQNYSAELKALDPGNQVLLRSETRMITAFVDEVNSIASEDVQRAISMTNEAIDLLPQDDRLLSTLTSLKDQQQQQELAKQQAKAAELESNITAMLNTVIENESYEQVLEEVSSYEAIQKDSVSVLALKDKVASQFVDAARAYLNNKRFANAKNVLYLAQQLDSQQTLINATNDAINAAEQAETERLKRIDEQSKIEQIKTSILAQIGIDDYESAESLIAALSGKIPSNDPFYLETIPAEYVKSYNRKGNSAFAAEEFEGAKGWFEKSLALDATDPEALKQIKIINGIQNIESLRNRDPVRARTMLDSLKREFPNNAYLNAIEPPSDNETTSRETGPQTTVSEVVAQPPANTRSDTRQNGVSCSLSLAGQGTRKPSCYDMLSEDFKGPRLVVLPTYQGKDLAMSRYEIRVAEYNFYCTESRNCQPLSMPDNQPVTGISIADAEGFVRYLNEVTGEQYRIPTIDEWQYAASANNQIEPKSKNCKASSGGVQILGFQMENVNYDRRRTQNSWGVTNFLGNASELVKEGENTSNYLAIGGSYKDSYKRCDINLVESIDNKLSSETGLRIVREVSR